MARVKLIGIIKRKISLLRDFFLPIGNDAPTSYAVAKLQNAFLGKEVAQSQRDGSSVFSVSTWVNLYSGEKIILPAMS